jgi:hypothetical protein
MPGVFSDKDIKSNSPQKSMFTLRETLIAIEEDRLNGHSDYTVEEVSAAMKAAIREAVDGKRG